MSVINKNSARLRDEERARLIWLLTTDKAIISTLLGKLTLAEQYDVGTLADDIAEVGALVAHLPPPDLADTLEALPSEERHALWRLVENEKRGNVLLEASENVWDDLIDEMSDRELLDALQYLDIDEQIYLVQHLPRNLTGRLLATLPAEERARVRQVLHYEKNSVGAIMEFEVITVRPDVTLEVVQRYLRRLGKMPENTDKLFVTDRNKVLVGELTLTCILLNDVQRKVSEVMEDDPLTFSPEDIAENAARTFERDNLVSAAVVDPSGKLMGRLTIDEIVDVVYEETDTDLRRMGGLSAEEDVFAPVTKAVKTRWAWLAVNLCTAFIASRVIDGFEHTISQLVALASLMPIVAGIGGNTGNQTITMIVRALALQNIQPGNLTFLILREMGVALINGLVWGGIMGGITWWLYDDMALGGVMTLAMMLNLLMAALMGVIIPMTMVKLGRDPAVGSSVMITAITDTGGFFIFLGLATLFLM
ncbi:MULTISPECIES: magnesium transporter [Citrobacter]|jgi:magnesium transporter|uniref:magnesium transporter n=1 Tax=Citrobacter TaxID=544 RepID=UPI0009AE9FF6|nr:MULTISPECIES: magnesium transporter [Citrobacter]MBA8420364.1 magnesium transporter [Citrobacter freundii]RNL76841.1 magnesium transporter [Citrobacter sp. MH181794]MBF0031145.1 magnesium transporter [Citrobacter freundii]MBJ9835805.1 magnesium transporter [Citrobacter freundii]MDE9614193.1 magnesium transporter [Citrobacter portucalensis]